MRIRRSIAGAMLVAVASVLLGASAARAADGDHVAFASDRFGAQGWEWVGQGKPHLFVDEQVSQSYAEDWVFSVQARDPSGEGEWFTLTFGVPQGQTLKPGVYGPTIGDPLAGSDRPAMNVYGGGHLCGQPVGQFEVKQFERAASGEITRAWIVFAQSCGSLHSGSTFGELRIGAPVQAGALRTLPAVVRWPEVSAGYEPEPAPVTVTSATGAAITGVALEGADAGAFALADDGCSGRTLPAGGSCQIVVRYPASQAGTRSAQLRVSDAAGASREVSLQGHARGGSTFVHFDSEPGDWVGDGKVWDFSPATTRLSLVGDDRGIRFVISDERPYFQDGLPASGSWFNAFFTAGPGRRLVPGSYQGATLYSGQGPGMYVTGAGRACDAIAGSFEVRDATYSADGSIRGAAIDFVQHCEETMPPLRGTLEFRAGDTTTSPPWLPGPPVAGPGDPPPGTGGAAATSPPSLGPASDEPASVLPGGPTSGPGAERPRPPRRPRVTTTLSRGGLVASRAGVVTLPVRCGRGEGACRGTASLARSPRGHAGGGAVLGRAGFTLVSSSQRRVRIALAPATRRALIRHRRLDIVLRLRGAVVPLTLRTTLRARS